ncbi:DUF5681 domain-containing protein [Candidatus Binatus sp.]|uniref:DUF5681 domain-containing protein n=1 Tax=Candidatus Binatus sp. TaxID=2811406 RepID=UPI003BC6823E
MKDKEKNEREYEVGYAKPPKHTRFQKGRSGNPKGRPKGSKGFDAIVRHELEDLVEVRQNGRVKKISKREVIIKQMVNKAAAGNQRATELLLLKMELLQRDWHGPGRAAGELDPEALERARELIWGKLN